MACEDDECSAYPLVDLMSGDGQSIADGEMQIVSLADDVLDAIEPGCADAEKAAYALGFAEAREMAAWVTFVVGPFKPGTTNRQKRQAAIEAYRSAIRSMKPKEA